MLSSKSWTKRAKGKKKFNLLVKVIPIELGDMTSVMHFILDSYFMDIEEKFWEDPSSDAK